ncbi:hypothetical protein ACLI2R_17375, partial [Enterococcus faecalis]|uniref:hypothetical protein n=1 Tax=Enterococcus faecalis TaxID=1351 RepID=UPI0039851B0F
MKYAVTPPANIKGINARVRAIRTIPNETAKAMDIGFSSSIHNQQYFVSLWQLHLQTPNEP